MLNTSYIEIQRYTSTYNVLSVEKTSNRKFIVRRKTILPRYIEGPKSGQQCSETFIDVFVFVTPRLNQWISVFARFCVTLEKVWARLP